MIKGKNNKGKKGKNKNKQEFIQEDKPQQNDYSMCIYENDKFFYLNFFVKPNAKDTLLTVYLVYYVF